MKALQLHKWDVSPVEATGIQNKLRKQVITENHVKDVKRIAGVDISIKNTTAIAAIVIISFPELKPLEQYVVTKKVEFDYIPGLLSFRESPSIIDAFEKVRQEPDLIMVDGQGIAHPRRFGIAAHLGILLNKPFIGCAKSLLCGKYDEPSEKAGSFSELHDKGKVIGAVLRTKDKTNPMYISIGHKIDLPTAISYAMKCCQGYRLPEPTRLADLAAGGKDVIRPVPLQAQLFS